MARLITIEDLYQIKIVSRPRISPDGRQVAFVVTSIDESKHAYCSSIWIASTDEGEAKPFTSGSANAHSPVWSPDGKWLAFVSDREPERGREESKSEKKQSKGKSQIWIIPTDGGEARQLTSLQHGASSPLWSPDSRYLLFSALVGPADPENEEGKALPKVRVIDRLWYRLDGVGFIHERRTQLFMIEPTGGEAKQITEGDWDSGDAAWSPDGTKIVFASDRTEDRWTIPGSDLYILSFKDGEWSDLRCLTDSTLGCASPSWSPDGSMLAFLASPKKRAGGQTYLYTISPEANRTTPTCLSQQFNGTCMDWTNSDIGDEHLMPAPGWSSDGKTLFALASYHGATRLFSFQVTGENAHPATVTPGNIHVRDFSFDAGRKKMALLVAEPTRPQEIFIGSPEGTGEIRRLTGFNDELFHDLLLASPEYMPYKGADEWSIDGWILKPHDFDPAKKYPLVVEIHGGPATQYGYGFFHEMQLLVAEGYVVLYTNPRGSCGYGYDFADAVRGAWGEKDSIDIMRGIDELLQRGYIDEQRIGVTGGSYGGFMTNWLIGHSDRFKVAITDRCVSNMASMFGTSDIGWDLAEENLDTTPWEALDKYMHMSPISSVQQMHTPLLIIHSEQDLRCSVEQAEQLFAALKWMKREVEFIRFEGQSHGLSRAGHPYSRQERLRHIRRWFAKYLQA